MASKLPKTKARLSTSIKIWYIESSQITPDVLLHPQATDLPSLKPKFIDGVEKFHEVDDRLTEPRYECDSKKRGDVVDRILKVVEKKISIDRVVFYKDDVADFFEFPSKELIDQNTPFAILKTEDVPEDSNATQRAILYLGCYIHNVPKTYELGRDLKVVQSINLGYKEKFVLDSTAITTI